MQNLVLLHPQKMGILQMQLLRIWNMCDRMLEMPAKNIGRRMNVPQLKTAAALTENVQRFSKMQGHTYQVYTVTKKSFLL